MDNSSWIHLPLTILYSSILLCLGYAESRVSVADIENRRNGDKKNRRHAFAVDSPPKVRLEDE